MLTQELIVGEVYLAEPLGNRDHPVPVRVVATCRRRDTNTGGQARDGVHVEVVADPDPNGASATIHLSKRDLYVPSASEHRAASQADRAGRRVGSQLMLRPQQILCPFSTVSASRAVDAVFDGSGTASEKGNSTPASKPASPLVVGSEDARALQAAAAYSGTRPAALLLDDADR